MTKPTIDLWANFLANEKLSPQRVGIDEVSLLLLLCGNLAERGRPDLRSHKTKVESRRLVVNQAMDLSIDLTAIKSRSNKVLMGRGLLDVWNQEYTKRFGSNLGTAGSKEAIRRNIVTKITCRFPLSSFLGVYKPKKPIRKATM